MKNLEDIKREAFSIIDLTDQPRVAVDKTIDYLHSRGYLGGVPDARLELEYERGRRDALMNLVEAAAPKG